jgi:hypothetical protein
MGIGIKEDAAGGALAFCHLMSQFCTGAFPVLGRVFLIRYWIGSGIGILFNSGTGLTRCWKDGYQAKADDTLYMAAVRATLQRVEICKN